ncbi:hypothetical protein [Roseinatronobacter monicus]|uniref:Uncharacterized protein n=1 Tax=Roseinatronobacter monicus TaxID=393481 RepID=A0A543K5Z2_9RHOB|nr:hypothetical protein [Roseinatronobacter monicus]TQM90489.1 hypothetical protein BD293_3877 [Roseinatronobacter monicus]
MRPAYSSYETAVDRRVGTLLALATTQWANRAGVRLAQHRRTAKWKMLWAARMAGSVMLRRGMNARLKVGNGPSVSMVDLEESAGHAALPQGGLETFPSARCNRYARYEKHV